MINARRLLRAFGIEWGYLMNKCCNRKYLLLLYTATLLFCFITGIIIVMGQHNSECVDTMSVISDRNCLIIDAGHGGADGGAVAADGSKESEINISVALKLKELCDLMGINNLMTRDSESLPYPESAASIADKKNWDQRRRLDIINSDPNAVLTSIHQNFYPDPRPSGVQVLYGKAGNSRELGEKCHEILNSVLTPDNRRLASAAPDNIFLMNRAECTAILVECGFISNPEELENLKTESYQMKIAAVLLAAYLEHIY